MESTATATCINCRSLFTYEPILVGSLDISRGLHTTCPACTHAADEEESTARRDEEKHRKLAIRRETLPPDLLATSSHHPAFNTRLWEVARAWRSSPDQRSLGIIGPAGICKTRVLGLLASRVIMQGTRIVWTSAVRLYDCVDVIKRSRDHQLITLSREHLQDCKSTPWLFLDDLGKNEWSRPFESHLFQILDHRINHHLPIAWTSNAHPEEFHTCLTPLNSAPIIGRLLDRTTLLDLRESND